MDTRRNKYLLAVIKSRTSDFVFCIWIIRGNLQSYERGTILVNNDLNIRQQNLTNCFIQAKTVVNLLRRNWQQFYNCWTTHIPFQYILAAYDSFYDIINARKI